MDTLPCIIEVKKIIDKRLLCDIQRSVFDQIYFICKKTSSTINSVGKKKTILAISFYQLLHKRDIFTVEFCGQFSTRPYVFCIKGNFNLSYPKCF